MLLTITDLIILGLCIMFFWGGWRRGLFRALFGPLAFAFGALAGILFYDLSDNLLGGLITTILTTIALSIIFTIIHYISRSTVDKEHRNYVFLGSRFLGSFLSVFWEGGLCVIIMVTITLLPNNLFGSGKAQNDIKNSNTYHLVNQFVINQAPPVKKIYLTVNILRDPAYLNYLSQSEEFKSFFLDPKIQSLLNDKNFYEQIRNKNILNLMTNPKIKIILKDKRLMRKFTKLGKRVYVDRTQGLDKKKALKATEE